MKLFTKHTTASCAECGEYPIHPEAGTILLLGRASGSMEEGARFFVCRPCLTAAVAYFAAKTGSPGVIDQMAKGITLAGRGGAISEGEMAKTLRALDRVKMQVAFEAKAARAEMHKEGCQGCDVCKPPDRISDKEWNDACEKVSRVSIPERIRMLGYGRVTDDVKGADRVHAVEQAIAAGKHVTFGTPQPGVAVEGPYPSDRCCTRDDNHVPCGHRFDMHRADGTCHGCTCKGFRLPGQALPEPKEPEVEDVPDSDGVRIARGGDDDEGIGGRDT